MASHCFTSSLRELYVDELKKYITIDIFGKCGNLKCPRNETHWISHDECYEKIESEYKFYLAFENSICTDYISEKFFYTLRYNIVPIVFGGANYEEIAPPHSYIDTRNFQSPKELALYILNLNSNDTLYYEYFKWKREFYVDAGIHNMSRQGFCELCSKLNRFDEPEKHYASLANDYSIDSNCIVLNENLI